MSVNIKSYQSESGFTITELLVAMTAGAIVALAVLSISLFFFSDLMGADARTRLTLESQNILSRVVEDLRVGTRVLTTNTLTDINQPGSGWNTNTDDHIIVVSVPARNSSNEFIFDGATGEPYQNEVIYFEGSGSNTLYKRTLANSSATGNIAKTTCPEASASASCPADPVLSEHFSDMSFVFYDQDNNITADPTLGRSIDITINMIQQVFGQTATAENNIRITLRNPT